MPRYQAESFHPEQVERFLHAQGFRHLRAQKRGAVVTVTSGPANDPVKHFRLVRDTVHLWILEMADHRGRWERTPYRDNLQNLLQAVAESFQWVLGPVGGNPERTSDPED